ncbi:hypothetical protein WSM22_37050 [Cytophagales bacterium WSM2-2]|nr:hypothetical protein WSM22_37050 [Cytophagales bacterium WSM2-2]
MVADGLTEMLDDVAPLLHKYDEAPLAVSVDELPAQIADTEAPILTDGAALTITVMFPDAEQPFEVPVTLYVVVTEGLTVIDDEVAPLLQT